MIEQKIKMDRKLMDEILFLEETIEKFQDDLSKKREVLTTIKNEEVACGA